MLIDPNDVRANNENEENIIIANRLVASFVPAIVALIIAALFLAGFFIMIFNKLFSGFVLLIFSFSIAFVAFVDINTRKRNNSNYKPPITYQRSSDTFVFINYDGKKIVIPSSSIYALRGGKSMLVTYREDGEVKKVIISYIEDKGSTIQEIQKYCKNKIL